MDELLSHYQEDEPSPTTVQNVKRRIAPPSHSRKRRKRIAKIEPSTDQISRALLEIQSALDTLTQSNPKLPPLFQTLLDSNSPNAIFFEHQEIENEKSRRAVCYRKLQTALQTEHSSVVIEPFGSTETNLFLPQSDIDLNVVSTDGSIAPRTLLVLLQKTVQHSFSNSATQCQLKLDARVPVLQIQRAYFGEIQCTYDIDVTAVPRDDEIYAHHEQVVTWTRQHLQLYEEMYRIHEIARLIKAWSKQKDLNCAYRNSLPSLAYLVILFSTVEFLESSRQAITITPEKSLRCQALQTLCDTLHSLQWKQELLPAALLLAFFLRLLNWDGLSCIRTEDSVGTNTIEHLEKLKAAWPDTEFRGFGQTYFIQDPFLIDVNLGRFVTNSSSRTMKRHLSSACEQLLGVEEKDK